MLGAIGWSCEALYYGQTGTSTDPPPTRFTDCDDSPTASTDTTLSADNNRAIDIRLSGWIQSTATGSATLQWGPVNAGGTLIIDKGSMLIAQKVGGADLAEMYYTTDLTLQPGDVVSLDSSIAAGVKKSTIPYDKNAVGIVSTQPGLLLGDSKTNTKDTSVIVALSGRVPVKVSMENGPIEAGDLLTASSQPGVAMRATKAGQIVGQAMISYRGEGIGTIPVFIKTDYANGATLSELLPGVSEDSTMPTSTALSKLALTYFVQQQEMLSTEVNLSEVSADRITAGLEVITPKVLAGEVSADVLTAATGTDVTLALGQEGKFVIRNASKNAETASSTIPLADEGDVAISFDRFGNAFFAGEIKAKSVSADKITGIEIYTNQLKELAKEMDDLAAEQAEAEEQKIALAELISRLTILEENSVKLQLTDAVLNTLNVTSFAVFSGGLKTDTVGSLGDFLALTSDTEFFGRPYFTTDTAGFAVITKGAKSVDVVFDREYMQQPIVNAMISLETSTSTAFQLLAAEQSTTTEALLASYEATIFAQDIRSLISKKTVKGFTILLNKPAPFDMTFGWIVLAVKDAKIIISSPSTELEVPLEVPLEAPTAEIITVQEELPPVLEDAITVEDPIEPREPAASEPIAVAPETESPQASAPEASPALLSSEPLSEETPVANPEVPPSKDQNVVPDQTIETPPETLEEQGGV